MKFTNTLAIPTHALRRMVTWVCRQVGCPVSQLRLVAFRRSRSDYSGLCRGRTCIGVRLGDGRFGFQYAWNDEWELLVAITGHEVAHANDFRESNRSNERSAEMQEQKVLAAFRASRESLLSEWLVEPPAQPRKAKPSLQQSRAIQASKHLARWQRKAKLAATKVKQYRKQVQYYERILASKTVASNEGDV